MKLHYTDSVTQGELHLIIDEAGFDRLFFQRDRKDKLLTIAWNNGPGQTVTVDGVRYDFPAHSILPLMINQSYNFERAGQVIAWQFNRDFYCIVDHDKEVSCVGFIFYGTAGAMFLELNERNREKLDSLLKVFIDEFNTSDTIQRDMLQMMLKRLIIILTRMAREQYVTTESLADDKLDILRKYNLLVENHYRSQHTVQFYAEQLHKSPKTLANLFGMYNHKSPLAVIQERVILEAKRLLMYTDKSSKEIAYELGFDDAAYFSNFFKKQTACSPSDFRNTKTSLLSGQ